MRWILTLTLSLVPYGCVTGQTRQVPDTLDLVQRAEYAINGLCGTVDPDHHCEFLFGGTLVPPTVRHDAYSFAACGPKYIESWTLCRYMSGSTAQQDIEQCAVEYIVSCLGKDDGLFYNLIGPERPWDKSSPEDWANIYGQARVLRALLAVSQVDDDPVWMQRMAKIVDTLKRIAVYKDDYAYYPTTPGYGDVFSYPRSGWKTTELELGGQEHLVGTSIADVPDHSFGIPLYLGGLVTPLAIYGDRTGDQSALELAGKMVRFLLKPESGWKPDGYPQGVVPEEHGWFYGHFHGHTLCLRGLLNYAIITNDMKLKNLVRDGYQFSRTFSIARLGWFQEYTGKASHETCGLANMTALAIKLSRAGVGDYWDDVDCYVRNHLTQSQFIDMSAARQANKDLTESQEELLTRLEGSFAGWGKPNQLSTKLMNCCMANGSQALYYGWDAILEPDSGPDQVTINLLLNRQSPWVDMESYLPYEGKVVIRNKNTNQIAVRVPGWLRKDQVNVRVNDKTVLKRWVQQYLILPSKANDTITLTFPVNEAKESYVVHDFEPRGAKFLGETTYTVTFRGNTAVAIEPKATEAIYPTYQANRLRAERAPMKAAAGYIAKSRIDW